MPLEGKELGLFPHLEWRLEKEGYTGLGKYFPFCAETCRFPIVYFPISRAGFWLIYL
jgi:hypothetical protein